MAHAPAPKTRNAHAAPGGRAHTQATTAQLQPQHLELQVCVVVMTKPAAPQIWGLAQGGALLVITPMRAAPPAAGRHFWLLAVLTLEAWLTWHVCWCHANTVVNFTVTWFWTATDCGCCAAHRQQARGPARCPRQGPQVCHCLAPTRATGLRLGACKEGGVQCAVCSCEGRNGGKQHAASQRREGERRAPRVRRGVGDKISAAWS